MPDFPTLTIRSGLSTLRPTGSFLSEAHLAELSSALLGRRIPDLQLSSAALTQLRSRLGSETEAFLSLAQESNPEFFYNALLRIAESLEGSGDLSAAALLYHHISESEDLPEGQDPLRGLANQHLETLQGGGPLGMRLETLTRQGLAQASDATGWLGMIGSNLAFRGTRLWTLSQIAAGGRLGLMARFLNPGLIANLAGFAVEVPTFTALTHLGGLALGREAHSPLGQELASGALFLGSLKVFSGIFASRNPLLAQLGTYLGILSAQQLEIWTGLRPEQSASERLTASLATWLQCHGSGRLIHALTPGSLQSLEAELDTRTQSFNLSLSLARLRPRIGSLPSWREGMRQILLAPLWMAMGGIGDGGRIPRRPSAKAPALETLKLRAPELEPRLSYPQAWPYYQTLIQLLITEYSDSGSSFERPLPLASLIPTHFLRFYPESGDGFFEDFQKLRERMVLRLSGSRWRPGQVPERDLLENLLRSGHPESSLPVVSMGNHLGLSLVIDGHKRLAALSSLVADGILPEATLENVPIRQSAIFEPQFVLMEALEYAEEIPGPFSWEEVMQFHPKSQALARRIGLNIDLGRMLHIPPEMSVEPEHWEKILAMAVGGIGVGALLQPGLAHASFHASESFSRGDFATGIGAFSALGLGVLAMVSGGSKPPRPSPPQSGIHRLPTRILESRRSPTVEMRREAEVTPASIATLENVFRTEEVFPIPRPPEGKELVLGRSTPQETNLFPPHFRQIGRRHLELRESSGQIEIRAHRGSRGLRINHQNLDPLQWYALREGDLLELVSEARLDMLAWAKDPDDPAQWVLTPHRMSEDALRSGNYPSEMEQAALFRFRRSAAAEDKGTPAASESSEATPWTRRTWKTLSSVFKNLNPFAAEAPAAPVRPRTTLQGVIPDLPRLQREVQRFSDQITAIMHLYQASLNDSRESHSAEQVLRALLTAHRGLCGSAERYETLQLSDFSASGRTLPRIRVPAWDRVFLLRLEYFEEALTRLEDSQNSAQALEIRDRLGILRDRLNRLLEIVRLFRRFAVTPEDNAIFDAIERAYHGLRPPPRHEIRQLSSAQSGLEVSISPEVRATWIEELTRQGPSARAIVNARIIMGEIERVRGREVFGDFYDSLAQSGSYDGLIPVRSLYDAESGELVAFFSNRSEADQVVAILRGEGRQLQEICFWVDAARSGRILEIQGIDPSHYESIRNSFTWLQGLQVLPARESNPPPPVAPREMRAWTHYVAGPETQALRLIFPPPGEIAGGTTRRVVGITPLASSVDAQGQAFWTLLSLERISDEPEASQNLPLQIWVLSSELGMLRLATGSPSTQILEICKISWSYATLSRRCRE